MYTNSDVMAICNREFLLNMALKAVPSAQHNNSPDIKFFKLIFRNLKAKDQNSKQHLHFRSPVL